MAREMELCLPSEILLLIFNYLETDEILDLLANDSSPLDQLLLQNLKIKNKPYYKVIVNKNYIILSNYPNELLDIFLITKNDTGIDWLVQQYKIECIYDVYNNLFFQYKDSNDHHRTLFISTCIIQVLFLPLCVYFYLHDFCKVKGDLEPRQCIGLVCEVFEHACYCGYLGIAKFIYIINFTVDCVTIIIC